MKSFLTFFLSLLHSHLTAHPLPSVAPPDTTRCPCAPHPLSSVAPPDTPWRPYAPNPLSSRGATCHHPTHPTLSRPWRHLTRPGYTTEDRCVDEAGLPDRRPPDTTRDSDVRPHGRASGGNVYKNLRHLVQGESQEAHLLWYSA